MRQERDHPGIARLRDRLAEGKIDRREFLRTATLLGMSLPAAYAVAGRITGAAIAPAARAQDLPKGGTLKCGMRVQAVKHPHAHDWQPPSNITLPVCETLTRTDQDNLTHPLLLERWEASDDLKTWDLFLRQGVKWHNGRDFVADDVVWNLNHILDPATGSSSIGLMKSYLLEDYETGETDEEGKPKTSTRLWAETAIEKISDKQVRLNLKVPFVAIPEHLFHYTNCILDPEEGGEFGVGSNGTGPFTLTEHRVGEMAVLEAVEGYWGEPPKLDRLIYVDLGDESSAEVAALASNQVDMITAADISQIDTLKSIPHLNIHESATAATSIVQMRVDVEPFGDERVRLALRYAVDAGTVLFKVLRDFGLKGEHHFVCPVHPDYAPLPEMTRDPAKAKALLAEAGHPDGIDIVMDCKRDPAWELAAVQEMQQQFAECNIRMDINVIPSAAFWDRWDQYPLCMISWNPRPLGFMALSLSLRTGVPWNSTRWGDKELDDLLTVAEATLDIEERKPVMEKIEIVMQQRGPIVQPVWQGILTASSKTVKGFRLHPATFIFPEQLAIES